MTWYFCYYVAAKYGQTYINPLECINTGVLRDTCHDVIIHTDTSHKIHEIGTHLKMYGLGTAIILETSHEPDVTMLKLMDNSIIDESKFRNEQKPILQLIVVSPNFKKLNVICQDLELARHYQQCSREDTDEVIRVIKRQADKLERMSEVMGEQLTDSFKKLTSDYLVSCLNEIDVQTEKHRLTTTKTTNLRRKLMHTFMPFVTYTHKDGGFK